MASEGGHEEARGQPLFVSSISFFTLLMFYIQAADFLGVTKPEEVCNDDTETCFFDALRAVWWPWAGLQV